MAVRLRQSLRMFAVQCEQVLRDNDHKGGWQYMGLKQLKDRVGDETEELGKAISAFYAGATAENRAAIQKEACDIANFAMMIHDSVGKMMTRGRAEEPK